MEMPPQDNPEQTGPNSPRPPQKETKRRTRLASYGMPILIALVLVSAIGIVFGLIVTHTIRINFGGSNIQEKPISEILNLADRHQLKSVLISGDELFATGISDQQYHAIKEDGQAVTEIFRRDGVAVSVDNGQRMQWTQLVVDVLLVTMIVGAMLFFLRRGGTGNHATAFTRSKAKRFNESHPTVLFKDVAGVEEAKTELEEIVEFLKYPERFVAMGARTPKGVLLVGAPGTGKTLISRAVAGEADVAFYNISGSEFVEMFVGVGAARVRDLFKEAKVHAPCIVFIDEIDAVGRQRNSSGVGGNDEREQTLNQLLVEMDGFESHTNIVVIAATNRPDVLDSALLRPGRFDRQVMLDKPDIRGRLAILEVHAKDKPLAGDVILADLARQTAGFSGAELAGAMGGRAAEEIIFGDITTGASQDIEYVTNIARRMVCEFGMSPLGNVAFKMEADGTSSISPETAARIDKEVSLLVEQAYETALHILQERKDKLITIAEHLIEVETIDGTELDAMLCVA